MSEDRSRDDNERTWIFDTFPGPKEYASEEVFGRTITGLVLLPFEIIIVALFSLISISRHGSVKIYRTESDDLFGVNSYPEPPINE